MGDVTVQRMPWEPVPVEETLELMRRDFAYAVQFTAVLVHSSHAELQLCVNTRRGQIIPRGESKFSDGTTIEFQDLGMPQPGVPTMTVQALVEEVLRISSLLGLEYVP